MRLAAICPVEDDIRRRDQLDFHRAGVERMLAGKQRLDPHALAADFNEVAVRETVAGQVDVLAANIADDDADITDRDFGERDELDGDKPRVEIPCTRQKHCLLETAATAGLDERLTT